MLLRINGTVNDSIVDGHGYRYVIFTQGCPHHCKGCHNPQTHDCDSGRLVEVKELYDELSANILLSGVTFSGGEPMMQPQSLLELAKLIRSQTDLDIIIYSGYTIEQLVAMDNPDILELLSLTYMLIDGKFVEELKDLEIGFKGSRNQREIILNPRVGESKSYDLATKKLLI